MSIASSARKTLVLVAAAVEWVSVPTSVGLGPPPGFEVVNLTNNTIEIYHDKVAINNCGEVVYDKKDGLGGHNTSEIVLYDNGKTTQLTNDDELDNNPDINDAGTIVWLAVEAGNPAIIIYEDGNETVLIDDNPGIPYINNRGYVTWTTQEGFNCDHLYQIWLYNGTSSQQLIGDSIYAYQLPHLNDNDEISFARYDWCHDPYYSTDLFYYDILNDNLVNLTGGQFPTDQQSQITSINNHGDVALGIRYVEGDGDIYVWDKENENLTHVLYNSDFIAPYAFNDKGDIAIGLWSDANGGWETWVYFDEQSYQITPTAKNNFPDSMNQYGEVILTYSNRDNYYSWNDVLLMQRIRTGDMDQDLDVDEDDAEAFAGSFTGEGDFDGLCEARFADIDHDRDVDCDDWELFKSNWSGEGDPPPLAPCACNGRERIAKAKCVIRDSAVSKAVAIVKNAAPGQEYTATLDTGQTLARVANDRGRVRFVFRRANKPPCGPNGASVCGLHESFGCDC